MLDSHQIDLNNPIITQKLEPKKTKLNKGCVDPSRRAKLTPNVAGNYRGKKASNELLTDKERKLHHIASEQKRRRNIKIGYDRLCNLVPKLIVEQQAGGTSEIIILQDSKCSKFGFGFKLTNEICFIYSG